MNISKILIAIGQKCGENAIVSSTETVWNSATFTGVKLSMVLDIEDESGICERMEEIISDSIGKATLLVDCEIEPYGELFKVDAFLMPA